MKYTEQEKELATMLLCADPDLSDTVITPRIKKLAKQYARQYNWYCFTNELRLSVKAFPLAIIYSLRRKLSFRAAFNVAKEDIYYHEQEEYYN